MKGLRPMKKLWYPTERDVFDFILKEILSFLHKAKQSSLLHFFTSPQSPALSRTGRII